MFVGNFQNGRNCLEMAKMAFKKAANDANGSKWLEITVND